MKPMRLMIWVTSLCNLNCPHCSQKPTMAAFRDYNMTLDELRWIVADSVNRGLHYEMIEFTGGEASMWPHLEDAVDIVKASGICDEIFLVTNGNNPDRIVSLSHKLSFYVLSTSQATKFQEAVHKYAKCPVLTNSHKHKPVPHKPIAGTLPATCCVANNPHGKPSDQYLYLDGRIYYCCNAFANATILGCMDESLSCSFSDDFVTYFANKDYKHPICSVCVCNANVWGKI